MSAIVGVSVNDDDDDDDDNNDDDDDDDEDEDDDDDNDDDDDDDILAAGCFCRKLSQVHQKFFFLSEESPRVKNF